jgi:hypothetical protein
MQVTGVARHPVAVLVGHVVVPNITSQYKVVAVRGTQTKGVPAQSPGVMVVGPLPVSFTHPVPVCVTHPVPVCFMQPVPVSLKHVTAVSFVQPPRDVPTSLIIRSLIRNAMPFLHSAHKGGSTSGEAHACCQNGQMGPQMRGEVSPYYAFAAFQCQD